jgi:protein subunit release factor A
VTTLDPRDLRIDSYRDSSSTVHPVRVTHLPTGLSATGRGGKSERANRLAAEEELLRLLEGAS